MRLRAKLALLLGAACSIAACSGDEGSGSTAACARDVDCPAGRVCEQGRCALPNVGSGGAAGTGNDSGSAASGGGPAEGGDENTDGAIATPCTADGECPSGTLCIALACRSTGACTAASDRTAVEAEYDVPGDGGARRLRVRDIARECGICAYCLVEAVNCGRTHCLTQCIDPTNLNCIPCICGENLQRVDCTARFETCAGVASTTCDGVADAS
jgi:hypothetical protein